jgi:hypothetical protein
MQKKTNSKHTNHESYSYNKSMNENGRKQNKMREERKGCILCFLNV